MAIVIFLRISFRKSRKKLILKKWNLYPHHAEGHVDPKVLALFLLHKMWLKLAKIDQKWNFSIFYCISSKTFSNE
jgi:hypothetical protein